MSEIPFEVQMYRQAASWAVWEQPTPVRRLAPNDIVNIAADKAVEVDRARMATIIRERIMVTDVAGLPPDVAMKVQELLYNLAEQVETGMLH